MSLLFAGLAPVQLEAIATLLERSPRDAMTAGNLAALELGSAAQSVATELRERLRAMGPSGLSTMLRAVAAERSAAMQAADRRLELVWTGPERDRTGTRETSVVVRELFQAAERDVLVSGYALYNARPIFEPLAERMRERPALRVRLFVNIARDDDVRGDDDLIFEFGRQFRARHWPQSRIPEVYYDPRSLTRDRGQRAVMHAKCVLVDDRRSFLTSANLTEAAQARNIELGVVINDAAWCRAVRQQFDDLVESGALRQVRSLQ